MKIKELFKFKFKIGQKLFAVFLLLVLLSSVVGGVFSYKTSVSSLETQLLASSDTQLEQLTMIVDRVVIPVMKDTDILARTLSTPTAANMTPVQGMNYATNAEVQAILKEFKAVHNDDTEVIGIGTSAGLFALEPQSKLADDFDTRTRVWFTKAMEHKGEVIISDPYVSAGSGNIVITLGKTTNDNKNVVAVNLSLKKYLTDTINSQKIGQHGYAYVVDSTERILTHPTIDAGTDLTEDVNNKLIFSSTSTTGTIKTKVDGEDARLIYKTNELTGWKVIGVLFDSELDELKIPIIKNTVIVIIGSLMLLIIVINVTNRHIIRPIKIITRTAENLATGDISQNIIPLTTKDEIGDLSRAFQKMTIQFRQLVSNLTESTQGLYHAADVLNEEITSTASASSRIYDMNKQVTDGSIIQAESTKEISRAVQESAIGINNIACSASEISDISDQTFRTADKGNSSIVQTMYQMNSIDESLKSSSEAVQSLMDKAKEIGTIAAIINSISTETNLLSLNASIEAARAGDSGRGFSVVANEVKKLSAQSAEASKQISGLITEINDKTRITVDSLIKMKTEVSSGITMSTSVNTLFSGIMENMSKLNHEIQGLSATSEEIAASSEEISSSAEQLSSISSSNSSNSQNALIDTQTQKNSITRINEQVNMVIQTAEKVKHDVQQFKI